MQPHKKDLVRYTYALVGPRNNAVRYVGCAGDSKKRLQEHMRSENLAAPKYQWLAELKPFRGRSCGVARPLFEGCSSRVQSRDEHGSLEAKSSLASPHPQEERQESQQLRERSDVGYGRIQHC